MISLPEDEIIRIMSDLNVMAHAILIMDEFLEKYALGTEDEILEEFRRFVMQRKSNLGTGGQAYATANHAVGSMVRALVQSVGEGHKNHIFDQAMRKGRDCYNGMFWSQVADTFLEEVEFEE